MPDRSKAVERAKTIWDAVGDKYSSWPAASKDPVSAQKPHGAFVQTFYNDVAKGSVGNDGAWPEGAIFVKDNYKPDASGKKPGDKVAVTIMWKGKEGWFWAKYQADGTVAKTPSDHKMPNMPLVGTDKLRCIGCHKAKQTRDFVVTAIE